MSDERGYACVTEYYHIRIHTLRCGVVVAALGQSYNQYARFPVDERKNNFCPRDGHDRTGRRYGFGADVKARPRLGRRSAHSHDSARVGGVPFAAAAAVRSSADPTVTR